MAKRLLDDSMLSSPSLAQCSPRAQDAWHRLILLADDFGCMDCNPRLLLGRGWPLRPDVAEDDLTGWLNEYAEAGMLAFWAEAGRVFAVLVNWNGPHGQRVREEYSDTNRKGSRRKTPTPPQDGTSRNLLDLLSRQFPARETPLSRSVPAAAVPVPVPVPVPAKRKPAPAPSAQTPPRFKPLQDRLVATFARHRHEPYLWQGEKDSNGLRALIATATDDEIDARFAFALEAVGWKQCNTIAQLRSKWTDITAPEAPARRFG